MILMKIITYSLSLYLLLKTIFLKADNSIIMSLFCNTNLNMIFVCFFFLQYIENKPGNFIDLETQEVVGTHQGVHQWTVGQRCNLSPFPLPYYVCEKDVESNKIYVVSKVWFIFWYTDKVFFNSNSSRHAFFFFLFCWCLAFTIDLFLRLVLKANYVKSNIDSAFSKFCVRSNTVPPSNVTEREILYLSLAPVGLRQCYSSSLK